MHPGMGAGGFGGGCLLEMARAACELLWDKNGEEEIRSGVQAWVLGGMGDPRDQGSGERVPQDGGERIPWDGEELAQMQPAVLAVPIQGVLRGCRHPSSSSSISSIYTHAC